LNFYHNSEGWGEGGSMYWNQCVVNGASYPKLW